MTLERKTIKWAVKLAIKKRERQREKKERKYMIKIKTQILAYEHAGKKKETKRPLNYIQLAGKYAISVENLISAIPMQKTGPKRRI